MKKCSDPAATPAQVAPEKCSDPTAPSTASIALVIDLGFGDSGKGISVDFLCSRTPDPARTLVLRFAGGHQVGHTVCVGGERHTFSNFGAGTFRGVATYYSSENTVFLPGFLAERKRLEAHDPKVFLDPWAQMTTPYDIAWNHVEERVKGHGSCGVGYGTTIRRLAAGVQFSVKDLSHPWIAAQKLAGVKHYYQDLLAGFPALEASWTAEVQDLNDGLFLELCQDARAYFQIQTLQEISSRFDHFVFEGNQGIPLDRIEGIYPHLSWSRTCSEAGLSLLEILGKSRSLSIGIYYVSRCYQTRHGAGPMSSDLPVTLINNQDEANTHNAWQGPFRTAELDPELLSWSLLTDSRSWSELCRLSTGEPFRKNLVITCLDQRPGFGALDLADRLAQDWHEVWGSYGTDSARFSLLKRKQTSPDNPDQP